MGLWWVYGGLMGVFWGPVGDDEYRLLLGLQPALLQAL